MNCEHEFKKLISGITSSEKKEFASISFENSSCLSEQSGLVLRVTVYW